MTIAIYPVLPNSSVGLIVDQREKTAHGTNYQQRDNIVPDYEPHYPSGSLSCSIYLKLCAELMLS